MEGNVTKKVETIGTIEAVTRYCIGKYILPKQVFQVKTKQFSNFSREK